MKVLTLKQPHASLVVLNAKRIETRSWNTNYRGTLLIHAGKAKTPAYRALADTETFSNYLQADTLIPFNPFDLLPFGLIIGMVDIIDSVKTETIREKFGDNNNMIYSHGHCWKLSIEELDFGNYGPGRYAWLLANCVKFERPIPARGNLSLWDYEPLQPDGMHEPAKKTLHSQPLTFFP